MGTLVTLALPSLGTLATACPRAASHHFDHEAVSVCLCRDALCGSRLPPPRHFCSTVVVASIPYYRFTPTAPPTCGGWRIQAHALGSGRFGSGLLSASSVGDVPIQYMVRHLRSRHRGLGSSRFLALFCGVHCVRMWVGSFGFINLSNVVVPREIICSTRCSAFRVGRNSGEEHGCMFWGTAKCRSLPPSRGS